MKNTLTAIALVAITLSFPAFSSPARADEISERLDRFERDLQVLNRKVYQKNTYPSASDDSLDSPSIDSGSGVSAADDGVRVSELEQQIRNLNGKIEELQHKNTKLKSELDSLKTDIEFRFKEISTAPATTTPAEEPKKTEKTKGKSVAAEEEVKEEPLKTKISAKESEKEEKVELAKKPGVLALPTEKEISSKSKTKETAKEEDETELEGDEDKVEIAKDAKTEVEKPKQDEATPKVQKEFNEAYEKINKGDYDSAEKALTRFIKKYPEEKITGTAYYWLGESYFARDNYEKAALQYLRGYKNFPENSKAPDNLLKLAMSLNEIGKKSEACTSFKKMKEQYPKASLSLLQKADAEMKKLDCK